MASPGLSGPAKRLLTVQAIFLFANSIAGVFVNIFLWQTHGMSAVTTFNLHFFSTIPVMFIAGGLLAKATRRAWGMTLGASLYTLFYALLLYWGEQAGGHLALLGHLIGTGSGFSWVTIHTLAYDLVRREQRDYYFGLNGLFNTAAMLAGPLLAGFLIFRFGGLLGYRVVFATAVGFFIFEMALSLGLQFSSTGEPFHWQSAFSPRVVPGWFRALLANYFAGAREGLLMVVVPVLIYSVGANALDFGRLNSVFALLTSAAFFVAGRVIQPHNRQRFFRFGVWGSFAAPVALAALPGAAAVLTFSALNAIFPVFWSVPYLSQYFDLIQSAPGSAERRVEFIISREIWLNLGRVTTAGAFLLAGSSLNGPGLKVLAIASIAPLLFLPRLMMPRQVPPAATDAPGAALALGGAGTRG